MEHVVNTAAQWEQEGKLTTVTVLLPVLLFIFYSFNMLSLLIFS